MPGITAGASPTPQLGGWWRPMGAASHRPHARSLRPNATKATGPNPVPTILSCPVLRGSLGCVIVVHVAGSPKVHDRDCLIRLHTITALLDFTRCSPSCSSYLRRTFVRLSCTYNQLTHSLQQSSMIVPNTGSSPRAGQFRPSVVLPC